MISVCVGLCWFIVNRVRKQPSCSDKGYLLAQDALRSEFGGLVRLGCPRGHYAVCGELHIGRDTPRTPAGRVVPAVVRTPGQVAEHVDLGPATPEFPPRVPALRDDEEGECRDGDDHRDHHPPHALPVGFPHPIEATAPAEKLAPALLPSPRARYVTDRNG